MAWLNATPKPPDGSRRAKHADKLPKISRLDQMKKDKIPVRMPPNPMPHIIDRLIEMGLTESNGMGQAPLSWREIMAWQEALGISLPPWEAKLIRQLSATYIAEGSRSELEGCPPPWRTEITQRERDVDQAGIESVLG